MKVTINNPFVIYGYKGAEYFCDRKKSARHKKATLKTESRLYFYDGKTFILLYSKCFQKSFL